MYMSKIHLELFSRLHSYQQRTEKKKHVAENPGTNLLGESLQHWQKKCWGNYCRHHSIPHVCGGSNNCHMVGKFEGIPLIFGHGLSW